MMCALTMVRNFEEWQMIYSPGGHHSTKPQAHLPERHQPKQITHSDWPWYLDNVFRNSLWRLIVPVLPVVPHYFIKTCCKCSLIWCKHLKASLWWGYVNELAMPVLPACGMTGSRQRYFQRKGHILRKVGEQGCAWGLSAKSCVLFYKPRRCIAW